MRGRWDGSITKERGGHLIAAHVRGFVQSRVMSVVSG